MLLGMYGGAIARDWPTRAMLAGVAVGGVVALFLVHPPGWSGSSAPGYWGDIVMPTVLACVPLAFARRAGVRRQPRSVPGE